MKVRFFLLGKVCPDEELNLYNESETVNKQKELFLLLLTDFLAINATFLVFYAFRVETGWFTILMQPELILPMLVIYLYWFISFLIAGLYRTAFSVSVIEEIGRIFKASFISILILFAIILIDDLFSGFKGGNRVLILIYWGLFLGITGSGRITIRTIQRRLLLGGIGRSKTLIVGFNPFATKIASDLRKERALGLDIVGFVKLEGQPSGEFGELKVVGDIEQIEDLIRQYKITELVIAGESQNEELLIDLLAKSVKLRVGLKLVPDYYGLVNGQVLKMQKQSFPILDINPQLMSNWERVARRVLEVGLAFIFLIFTPKSKSE